MWGASLDASPHTQNLPTPRKEDRFPQALLKRREYLTIAYA